MFLDLKVICEKYENYRNFLDTHVGDDPTQFYKYHFKNNKHVIVNEDETNF